MGHTAMDKDFAGKTRIFLAAPFQPVGGGIGRMMTYLAQDGAALAPDFTFIPVETRGGGSPWLAPFYIFLAIIKLYQSRNASTILHVNMAERASAWRKGALIAAAKLFGIPSVLHLHAAEIIEVYQHLGTFKRHRLRDIFQAATVVVVLDAQWQDFVHRQLGVDTVRIEILPNGVPDPGNPNLYRSPLITELLFAGNLLPRKGLADLLAAMAQSRFRTRQWRLTIIGAGDAQALYAKADALGIGAHIHFLGWQPRALVTAALRHTDIFVLPSHAEGLPLVVLEALSLAVPVVCTKVGALPSWLDDRKNALLVPIGNPAALADAIATLITTPPLAASIGAGGRELYLESFTLQHFVHGLTAIYHLHCLTGRVCAPLAPAIPALVES